MGIPTLEDDRPVIGECAVCGCDIHGESPGYYGDVYYDFYGEYVCEDCLKDYANAHFRKEG